MEKRLCRSVRWKNVGFKIYVNYDFNLVKIKIYIRKDWKIIYVV